MVCGVPGRTHAAASDTWMGRPPVGVGLPPACDGAAFDAVWGPGDAGDPVPAPFEVTEVDGDGLAALPFAPAIVVVDASATCAEAGVSVARSVPPQAEPRASTSAPSTGVTSRRALTRLRPVTTPHPPAGGLSAAGYYARGASTCRSSCRSR